MLMHIFNVSVGMTFSAGIIDLLLFGIIQGNSKTNWIMILPVGICYFIMYYFVFKFIIKKMNLITPGREEDEVQSKLFTKNDFNVGTEKNIVSQIVLGLGGVENVLDVGCCISRLRISVKNSEKVSEVILKNTGASGVIKKGTAVQIVYGPKAAVIKSELEEYIKSL
ncbi:MAG: glucose PTS transporter subunit EIIB, partial [Firmicutes bacterium]|nr:glucose PTS transporter subunit EIIB [Bacillota bacterium]